MSTENGLPRGWTRAVLRTLVERSQSIKPPQRGRGVFKYVDIEALDNQRQRISSPKTIPNEEAPSRARMLIHQGDVLFSLVRPYLKNIAVVPSELDGEVASTAYCVLRPQAGIDSKYLFYQLVQDSFIASIPTYGNSPPAARDEEFLGLQVNLAPTTEQERIVAKIDELLSGLDAGVCALERAKANLKRHRAAILNAAVSGELTAEWRADHPHTEPASKLLDRILAERRRKWEADQRAKFDSAGKAPAKNWQDKYAEPAPLDTASLPKLPPGWCWSSLGQCFEVYVGATPSRLEPKYWNGSIPWVSSGQVQFNRIREPKEFITAEGLENSSTQLNPKGSVLLGMIGEGKTRGQVAILDIEACNNQNCAAIWVSATPIPPEYVFYWLWSRYEETRRNSAGNNQPALNRTRVETIPIPLPPLAEQEVIVSEVEQRLSVLAVTDDYIAASLKRAARLRQSILNEAFAGRLVPQDPADEPAAKLLERLRQPGQTATENGKSLPPTGQKRRRQH